MRCRHGMELSQIACPAGCGGTDLPRKHVGAGRAIPAAPKPARRNASEIPDDEVERALTASDSLREVWLRLGVDGRSMMPRIQASSHWRALFVAVKKRGLANARRSHGWRAQ